MDGQRFDQPSGRSPWAVIQRASPGTVECAPTVWALMDGAVGQVAVLVAWSGAATAASAVLLRPPCFAS